MVKVRKYVQPNGIGESGEMEMSKIQINLPVEGMTCTSCIGRVERALSQIEGVARANVDLAKGQANITFVDGEVEISDLVRAVQDCGYQIPVENIILQIEGMTCFSCVARVDGALRDVPGVIDSRVNLATEKTSLSFVPEVASMEDFKRAVANTGKRVLDPASMNATNEQNEQQMLYESSPRRGCCG
jgi:copper ion binding protein